ncbi:MAG TPA: hypothetical protein VGX70_13350 [Gemmataceae bacterium]|nr:hypothetical protein [Gemmataceae bacterium]
MSEFIRLIVRRGAFRTFRGFLIVFAAIALLPLATRAQTVDEVIAKNTQAHGGMEKLKSVQTIRVAGKVNFGSFRAAFVQENKRADRVREETIIQGLAQVQAYDGKTGWQINPFGGRKGAELLSADDLKSLAEDADIDGQLVDYKAKGHTAELIGHDSVEGTDCYKVRLALKDGTVRYYYLDTDSFLELKIETQRTIRGTVQETEMYFGDYEEVNGLYFSFAFEGGEKGDPNRAKFTLDKVEINVPLDDARFSMPVAKPEGKTAGGAN